MGLSPYGLLLVFNFRKLRVISLELEWGPFLLVYISDDPRLIEFFDAVRVMQTYLVLDTHYGGTEGRTRHTVPWSLLRYGTRSMYIPGKRHSIQRYWKGYVTHNSTTTFSDIARVMWTYQVIDMQFRLAERSCWHSLPQYRTEQFTSNSATAFLDIARIRLSVSFSIVRASLSGGLVVQLCVFCLARFDVSKGLLSVVDVGVSVSTLLSTNVFAPIARSITEVSGDVFGQLLGVVNFAIYVPAHDVVSSS